MVRQTSKRIVAGALGIRIRTLSRFVLYSFR